MDVEWEKVAVHGSNIAKGNPMYGKDPWNKGLPKDEQPFFAKKHKESSKRKIGKAQLKDKNHQWKGKDAGYQAIHLWVRARLKKPRRCQKCGKKTEDLDCCNISGNYTRDLDDWQYLCRSCHTKFDKKHKAKRKVKGGKFVENSYS